MRIEKLIPAYKDYLWGGEKLKKKYGKNTDMTPCAESWELSFHKDGMTALRNGLHLADAFSEEELGDNVGAFKFFPTLIKFIDANDNLSIQVHPSDEFALENENSYGKTEMWYIVEAEEGAGLYVGFKEDVTKEQYESAIRENKLTDLLNFFKVKTGETYFIPSGTVHAIGKGCLICEIQQNSNLTYRVYDYGRMDKNGNTRPLHVDRALQVSDLSAYRQSTIGATSENGELLGISKYFTVSRMSVKGSGELICDEKSFRCVTCVGGEGCLGDKQIRVGDSYMISACDEKVVLAGEMTLIVTSIRKYYVGIDLGGTFIKGGIVDDLGNLIISDKAPTESDRGDKAVAANIAALVKKLLAATNLTASDIEGVGIGVPGMIDSKAGEVVYSNNLRWKNFMISETVEKLVGIPVKIANDANVAALGETIFGCGKDYNDTVLLTLGTGVGGGIVIGGKLYEGNRSAGAELGHSVIAMGGELCTCGRRGCLEAYASATALIRDTKRAMEADKDSKMWQIGGLDKVDGSTAFRYLDTDNSAKKVVDGYLNALACGITNIANELRPEAVILGGGICAEGERLTEPLQKLLDSEIFGGNDGPTVKILTATLGNRAGILGAAALWMN